MRLGTQSASRSLLVAFLRANFKFSLCPGEAGCARAGIAALDIRLARLALAWVGMQNFDQSTECLHERQKYDWGIPLRIQDREKQCKWRRDSPGRRHCARRNGDVDEIDFVVLSGVKTLPAHGAATIGLLETAG